MQLLIDNTSASFLGVPGLARPCVSSFFLEILGLPFDCRSCELPATFVSCGTVRVAETLTFATLNLASADVFLPTPWLQSRFSVHGEPFFILNIKLLKTKLLTWGRIPRRSILRHSYSTRFGCAGQARPRPFADRHTGRDWCGHTDWRIVTTRCRLPSAAKMGIHDAATSYWQRERRIRGRGRFDGALPFYSVSCQERRTCGRCDLLPFYHISHFYGMRN